MFDLQATIRWVTEVLKDPRGAAAAYRETSPPWSQSFVQITLPVYLAATLAGIVVAAITGGSLLLGRPSAGVIVLSLAWSLAWTFVIAFIFDFFAGFFDGTRDFNAAYAVVALAIIPSALGAAIAPLPWIGWLIGLAASIYSLVLAYRFLGVFQLIPEASRVAHFVASVVTAIVVNLLVTLLLGAMLAPSILQSSAGTVGGDDVGGGIFSGFDRQADYAQAAARDTYEPPAHGKLTRSQVQTYVDMMQKTAALRERLGGKLESLEDEEPSISDIFGGVGDAVRMTTAEMEVVKSADGNWAEHQWVKGQIETARIQQDLNATTSHNYRLFLDFAEAIETIE